MTFFLLYKYGFHVLFVILGMTKYFMITQWILRSIYFLNIFGYIDGFVIRFMDLYYVSYGITIFSSKYGFEIVFVVIGIVLLIKIMVIFKFKNYI